MSDSHSGELFDVFVRTPDLLGVKLFSRLSYPDASRICSYCNYLFSDFDVTVFFYLVFNSIYSYETVE